MKVLFTGASGSLGREFSSLFNNVRPSSVRFGMEALPVEIVNFSDDVVIHASANLNPPDRIAAYSDNVLLSKNIVEHISRANSAAHIIIIGSMSVLNESGELKSEEEMSFYSFSKYCLERSAFSWSKNPMTIVRFSTLFTCDPQVDGLSSVVFKASRDGKVTINCSKRDFVPIDISCESLYRVCCDEKYYGKIVNICSGVQTNMQDIGRFLSEKFGTKITYKKSRKKDGVCSLFDSRDESNICGQDFDIYDRIESYYKKLKGTNNG